MAETEPGRRRMNPRLESSLFQSHVGVEVDPRGLGRFVAKPECDHGLVDPSPQEGHRGGVPRGPAVSSIARKRGAGRTGGCDVSCDEPLQRVGAQEPAA